MLNRWVWLLGFAVACIPAMAADSSLLNLLTPDASLLTGIDMARSKNSPFGRYLLARMNTGSGRLSKLISLKGFDPGRDLAEIVTGGRGMDRDQLGIVAARGTFDVGVLTAEAISRGASVATYRGVDLIRGSAPNSPVVAFLDTTLVVAGQAIAVRAAIDRWKKAGQLNAETAGKIAGLSADSNAWFLLLGSPSMFAGQVKGRILGAALQGDTIQAIQQASGAVRFGPVVSITADAVLATDKDASNLADLVRFLVMMIPSGAGGELSKNLVLRPEGNHLNFSLTLPAAAFEGLFRLFEQLAGGRSNLSFLPPTLPPRQPGAGRGH